MNNRLFFISSEKAVDRILEEGILPPSELFRKIDSGQLDAEVLGVSAQSRSQSLTPDYVSLESHPNTEARLKLYHPFNLYLRGVIPAIFEIQQDIRRDSHFIDESRSRTEFGVVWPETELALYKGTIPSSMIIDYRMLTDTCRDNPNSWDYIDTAYQVFKVMHQ